MSLFLPTRPQLLLSITAVLGLWYPWNTVQAGDYLNSAHGDATNGVSGRASGYATGNCAHCHDQHASRGGTTHTPHRALRGLAEENLCLDCHDGSPATDDISTQLGKTYAHKVTKYADRHSSSALEQTNGGSSYQGASRHVECTDCHNPHKAQTGNHSYDVASSGADNNLVSNALTGVWGVEPDSEPSWGSANVNYSAVDPATKEYQICFKCHSYYGLQETDGIATGTTGPSEQTATDQAMEFSKSNKSVHPVRVGLDNQTGSDAPKNLKYASSLKSPWTNLGVQTMQCSDCHGADSGAVGPHGSANKYLITGSTNYEWPFNSAQNNRLWTLDDVYYSRNNAATTLLCMKCHTMNISGGKFDNFVHEKHKNRDFKGGPWDTAYPKYGTGAGESTTDSGYPCITCHTVIPHGSKRSRLIGYATDAAPYSLDQGGGLTWPLVHGFKKVADPFDSSTKDCATGYDKCNCYAKDPTGTTTPCDSKHPNDGSMTYDP